MRLYSIISDPYKVANNNYRSYRTDNTFKMVVGRKKLAQRKPIPTLRSATVSKTILGDLFSLLEVWRTKYRISINQYSEEAIR